MLRNKTALPVLQKTYDESYLTCSTAVYYEGQVRDCAPLVVVCFLFLFSPHMLTCIAIGQREGGNALLEIRTRQHT